MTTNAPAVPRRLDRLRACCRGIPATVALVLLVATAVTGCVAGSPSFSALEPAGFWVGLWHGAISVVTLIVGIFDESVKVYETDNIGGWYDFGFLLGVVAVWGGSLVGGSMGGSRRRRMRRPAE